MYSSKAQEAHLRHWAAELDLGVGQGWWIYSKGATADGRHLGWDRTHNSLEMSVAGQLWYGIDRFRLGPVAEYTQINDYYMLISADTFAQPNLYVISPNFNIHFARLGMALEYDLISGKKMSFSPQVAAGTFQTDALHPQRDHYRARWWIEVGLTHKLDLAENLQLTVKPLYSVMTIRTDRTASFGEKHNIYWIGLKLGIRWWVI